MVSVRVLVFWGVMFLAGTCGLSLFFCLAVFAKTVTVAASLQVRFLGQGQCAGVGPVGCMEGRAVAHTRQPSPTLRNTHTQSNPTSPLQNLVILIFIISSGFIVNQQDLAGGWKGACERRGAPRRPAGSGDPRAALHSARCAAFHGVALPGEARHAPLLSPLLCLLPLPLQTGPIPPRTSCRP